MIKIIIFIYFLFLYCNLLVSKENKFIFTGQYYEIEIGSKKIEKNKTLEVKNDIQTIEVVDYDIDLEPKVSVYHEKNIVIQTKEIEKNDILSYLFKNSDRPFIKKFLQKNSKLINQIYADKILNSRFDKLYRETIVDKNIIKARYNNSILFFQNKKVLNYVIKKKQQIERKEMLSLINEIKKLEIEEEESRLKLVDTLEIIDKKNIKLDEKINTLIKNNTKHEKVNNIIKNREELKEILLKF